MPILLLSSFKLLKQFLKTKFQTPNDDFSDKETRVSVTLLEYGHLKNVTDGGTSKDVDILKENFVESQSEEGASKLNVKMVTNLMNLQSGELHKAAEQYTQLKGQVRQARSSHNDTE